MLINGYSVVVLVRGSPYLPAFSVSNIAIQQNEFFHLGLAARQSYPAQGIAGFQTLGGSGIFAIPGIILSSRSWSASLVSKQGKEFEKLCGL